MPSDSEIRSDAALLALRPLIPAAAPDMDEPATVGHFLHATLRPVLKLQNDLLLAVVADFVADHHLPLASADATTRQRLLTELLGRNTKLRATIVGLVTALFTTDEYTFYRLHRSELNRRLLDLALRRALDQAEKVSGLPAGT